MKADCWIDIHVSEIRLVMLLDTVAHLPPQNSGSRGRIATGSRQLGYKVKLF